MIPFAIGLLVLCFIFLVAYGWWYNSSTQKGRRGEIYVSKVLEELSDDYTVLNDVVLQTDKGTTQIDHIVISKYGVFVIETKNYRGEIYGDDKRKEWTQVIVTDVTYRRKWYKTYTYVTKNQFYNPVKQSLGHMFKVKELLKDYPHLSVVPLVVFAGYADLTNVYSNHAVLQIEQLLSTIEGNQTIYLTDNDVHNVVSVLVQNNVRETVKNRDHISNIRFAERQTLNKIESGVCPRCGGTLIKRNGKFGSFYGCSNYPSCKFTAKCD